MRSWATLFVAHLSACTAPLAVPNQAAIACAKTSDCPSSLVCETTRARCVDPKAPAATPPQFLGANALDELHVVLTFSTPLDATGAADLSHYQIDLGLTISAAAPSHDGLSVELTVSPQSDGLVYTITASDVPDILGLLVAPGSQQTFTGFGPQGDQTPPNILSPLPGSIQIGTVTLAWSHRDLAEHYVVEVASDSAFTQVISGSPFVIDDPQTTLSVTLPDPITYYWRVRADTTTPGLFSTSTVQMLDATIYVYCPSSATTCADTSSVGNQSAPFQTIAGALGLATALGLSDIAVAARGGGAVYSEHLVVSSGITLLGGYTPAFDSRDATINLTVIDEASPPTISIVGVAAPTLLDGFTIFGESDTAIAVSANTGSVLTISNNIIVAKLHALTIASGAADPSSIVVSNNQMSGIEPGDLAQAVSISASGATLSANTIVSGDNIDIAGESVTAPYAVSVDHGAALILGNTITAGREASPILVYGVTSTASAMTISGNIIYAQAGMGTAAYGISIDSSASGADGAVVITNNIVTAGDAQQQSTGLVLSNGTSANPQIVSNNDFSSGNASASTAAIDKNEGSSSYENNIMFTTGGAFRVCFSDGNSLGVGFFCNNLLFDCPQALATFVDSGTVEPITQIEQLNDGAGLGGSGLAGSSGGSSGGGSSAIIANNLTSDDATLAFKSFPDDLHLTANTLDAVRNQGLDASQGVCGKSGTASCGDVTTDLDAQPRTCSSPTACDSIGAYELDVP